MSLLLRDVELLTGLRTDVRLRSGAIQAIGRLSREPGEPVLEGAGGALSVGLTDHHLHLLALAAAATSVDLHPAAAPDFAAVCAVLSAATPDPTGWIRAVGYAEQAGPLHAARLDAARADAARPDVPVRVQHRSGAMWMLNTPALKALNASEADGRLFRADSWLAERLPAAPPPDLARVGRQLSAYGITAVTDATPRLPERSQELLVSAAMDGRLPQRLMLLGAESNAPLPPSVTRGPVKILLSDHELPGYEQLCRELRLARGDGPIRRPVAVHCVTREALALAIAALDETGAAPGDRIEHGSLISSEARRQLHHLGVMVVTQPGFIADRGDDYRRDLPPEDLADLYRVASLEAAGVPVACSSDAPFGPLDPWTVIKAAAERRTPSGAVLGSGERIGVRRALRSYLASPLDPGGPARQLRVGAAADLVLLQVPWAQALASPSSDLVRCTLIEGNVLAAATPGRDRNGSSHG